MTDQSTNDTGLVATCPGHVADTEPELRAMMSDCPACQAIAYPENPD